MPTENLSLIGRTTEEIRAVVQSAAGLPPYRGSQVAEWLYRRIQPGQNGGFLADFTVMTDLPVAVRTTLQVAFGQPLLTLDRMQTDTRDGTIKALAKLTNGDHPIECVLLPDVKRVSVCLSTQVGCPMACAFCATGTQGLPKQVVNPI